MKLERKKTKKIKRTLKKKSGRFLGLVRKRKQHDSMED